MCDLCTSQEKTQLHHIVYQCDGGNDSPDNLINLCRDCHVNYHSLKNDYAAWGRNGGLKTAKNPANWQRNLKQYRRK